jgi:hypothetical protein
MENSWYTVHRNNIMRFAPPTLDNGSVIKTIKRCALYTHRFFYYKINQV